MDICQEVESIEIEIGHVETLHKILLGKYFHTSKNAMNPASKNPADRMAVYTLCKSYEEYSTLVDISFDSLTDIKSRLRNVIDDEKVS